jgi:hypothetical protein
MGRVMNRVGVGVYRSIFFCIVAVLLVCAIASEGLAASKNVKQKTFNSAENAAEALFNAAKAQNEREMDAIFGPTGKDLIVSRDQAVNKDLYERFVKAYGEKNRLDISMDNKALLYVGNNEWPFPVPIVRKGNTWSFDTKQGKTEVLRRRIGRNELDTIQSCLAYVDAQKDYARMTAPKDSQGEYARKFISDPGMRNGLYWETKEGEEPSPLGIFMARARKEGMQRKTTDKPVPYHGYYYRILTSQGKNASGGAQDYVANGRMTGGFALVAYPAEYGVTGVMTFIVNRDGVVYQKNLGKQTAKTAQAMTAFDPDTTWTQVK